MTGYDDAHVYQPETVMFGSFVKKYQILSISEKIIRHTAH